MFVCKRIFMLIFCLWTNVTFSQKTDTIMITMYYENLHENVNKYMQSFDYKLHKSDSIIPIQNEHSPTVFDSIRYYSFLNGKLAIYYSVQHNNHFFDFLQTENDELLVLFWQEFPMFNISNTEANSNFIYRVKLFVEGYELNAFFNSKGSFQSFYLYNTFL